MALNKPQIEANKLLNNLGWSKPGDLTLNEIAFASNAFVEESIIEGSEGRIVMRGNEAIITVSSKIEFEPKKKFVLSHEIGHLILHKDISELFSDTDKTLYDWFANGKHEIEANQFASELLMPSELFKSRVIGEKMSLDLIRETADFFGTSQTATLLKYKDLGDFSVSIIYMENGIVKWKTESTDFPLKFLKIGSKAPDGSVAGDFFNGQGLEEAPVLVEALEWFPDDFGIEEHLETELYEHNFRIGTNGLLCCLWMQ
ncbi:ImmA/IrrE family metallo-endopeptidase [Yeosuana marina]|uniref:ImmA/IrrE family metallo-endopeptidase n=1 Tax=Yeosuana marina TaxID=1565536 RepID=UPI0014225C30|nr:ImmA/IrrE family metallo-endopeptidase [Yeosuana marina]